VADVLLIVDGDNVAHRRGAGGSPERLREELIAAVSAHVEQGGWQAILVLDGHGSAFSIGRLSISYAGSETADSVIERLAHRHAETHDVTVISSDSVLRHVAQRSGVHVMSAGEFVNRLAASARPPDRGPVSRQRYQLGDAVDPATRAKLEQIRRRPRGST
jgi:predicted RNA-binding protein with PIN domain